MAFVATLLFGLKRVALDVIPVGGHRLRACLTPFLPAIEHCMGVTGLGGAVEQFWDNQGSRHISELSGADPRP